MPGARDDTLIDRLFARIEDKRDELAEFTRELVHLASAKEQYTADDVASICEKYVPHGIRVIQTDQDVTGSGTAISAGLATVYV